MNLAGNKFAERLAAERRRFYARIETAAAANRPLLLPPPRPAPAIPLEVTDAMLSAIAAATVPPCPDAQVLAARQVALVLLAEAFGRKAAAQVFETLPEAVSAARARVTPLIAEGMLPVRPDVESFWDIFAALAGAPFRWTINAIVRLVAEEFEVLEADLRSRRRTRDVVRARQTVMFLARRFTTQSFPEIGRRVGGRDHTTVLYSFRTVEAVATAAGIDGGDDPRAWASALAALPPDWASLTKAHCGALK